MRNAYYGQSIRFIGQSGLWNGKMRDHLTAFIQADDKIFNPIKELTDVLNSNHLITKKRKNYEKAI